MCELLGLSFNSPVTPNFSFKGFRNRGDENPHGWGLAFYPDESAQIIKEPIKATRSPLSDFLQDYPAVQSKIIIAHVRYTSGSEKSHRNTHPFYRELNGQDYVFAHNGTLNGFRDLAIQDYKPIGETDSEYAFCHILNFIKKTSCDGNIQLFPALAKKFQEINTYGNFNCILSDGKFLFCYFDKRGYKGLCFVKRRPPYGMTTLLDEDWQINLFKEKSASQQGYVIATRPLTDEHWETFSRGELIVFKAGKIIYSNYRDVDEITQESLTDAELKLLKILRKSPHRVNIMTLISESRLPKNKVLKAIDSLLAQKMIQQDIRDNIDWNHDLATFYTNMEFRDKIDQLIE
jgi:glutamine amidotransferase